MYSVVKVTTPLIRATGNIFLLNVSTSYAVIIIKSFKAALS